MKLLLDVFFYLNEFHELFKFSTLGGISQYGNRWGIHLHYIWLSWQGKKNLQQLIKITNLTKIEKKIISTSWSQQLTLKNKVTHQHISTYPKSFLVTRKFSSLFIIKSLLNVNLYTWSAFILHVVYFGKTSYSWYKSSQPFLLMPKILWYAQNSQCVQNSVFPSRNHIFPNSLINYYI